MLVYDKFCRENEGGNMEYDHPRVMLGRSGVGSRPDCIGPHSEMGKPLESSRGLL